MQTAPTHPEPANLRAVGTWLRIAVLSKNAWRGAQFLRLFWTLGLLVLNRALQGKGKGDGKGGKGSGEVCRNFLRGYCKFGASCHHIHSKEPQSGSAVLTPPRTRMRTARSASSAGCSPPVGHAAARITPCGASAELNSLGSI